MSIHHRYILAVSASLLMLTGYASRHAATATAPVKKAVRQAAQSPSQGAKPLSHNDSLRFKLYYFEAVKQQTQGNFDAAYDLLCHCRDINPNAAEAWFMLSYYNAGLKGDSASLADVKRAADLMPSNNDYLERLATGYIKVNQDRQAIDTYEKLAKNSPERTDILTTLGQLYNRQKDYDGVLRTTERIEALEGSSEESALAKMRIYALQGKKDLELKELQALCARYPNDMNYRVMTGNWLLQNGQPQKALNEYLSALKEEPDNAAARMSLVDYYRSMGDSLRADSIQTDILVSPQTPIDTKVSIMRQVVVDNEKSGADSTRVLRLFHKMLAVKQPTTDMAELYVAYMQLKLMPQDSIDAVLETILKDAPDNTSARLQLIQSEWSKEHYNRVETLSRQALDYNADVMAFHYFLGIALMQQDRDKEALATFRKGVSLESAKENTALLSDCYAIMGDILHDMGMEQQAYAAYDSCLQYKDDNFGCLNNYAYYLSIKGKQLSRAEQMSYRAVQAEPDNSTYLDTYAWILFKQQRYDEAAEYIVLAVDNDTTQSAVLLEHAGDIFAKKGDLSTALKYWRQAADLDDGTNKTLLRKIKQKKYIDEK